MIVIMDNIFILKISYETGILSDIISLDNYWAIGGSDNEKILGILR